VVATKAGRRLDPHVVDGYNAQNLTAFVARSLKNLETDSIDLLQLHCPPTEAYYRPELFGILDDMVSDGLIRHYGVSVEKVEEALKAIEYPGVSTVQIIFNAFRQRPAGLFFGEAKKRDVGVIVRVPLASGLLSGKMNRKSTFAADDHRSFNRRGEAFDRGETFAGVDFNSGLEAVEELRPLVPQGATMAQLALRWILMFDAVSTVIPGARNTEQATQNAAAADLAPLSKKAMAKITEIYETRIKDQVHHRW
jgi:aryl-alcohol dehydrogenase-like predicted oxidoreductase